MVKNTGFETCNDSDGPGSANEGGGRRALLSSSEHWRDGHCTGLGVGSYRKTEHEENAGPLAPA